MRRFIVAVFSIVFLNSFFSNQINAQTQSELIIQAKELIRNKNETAAYPLLVKAVSAGNTNLEALSLAAFYADKEGNRQTDDKKRNDFYQASKIFANRAYQLYPNNAEANYVMGVALGRIALISSSKEKVKLSKQIKELGEKCVQLNPNHAGGFHLLGKWHYEVYNLNFIEKAAVNLLFGGLPAANINTSCILLLKAIQLRPDYLLYKLDAAKSLHQAGKNEDALKQLKNIMAAKPTTQDDFSIIEEANKLLAKWS